MAASEDILTLPPPGADVRIAYGKHACQFGDLRMPAGLGPHPLVILIHGGYWRARYDLAYCGHVAAALARRGVASWNIEYRRVGQQGGGWPGIFEDVARAADYVHVLAGREPIDAARVIAVGHSAGGHLALWLAGRAKQAPAPDALRLRGVLALAPLCDLRRAYSLQLSNGAAAELLGGSPERYPERYAAASPAELAPLGVPQVLIHGDADDAVPFAQSEDYAALGAARGDQVRLVRLPGAGHFEVVDPRTPEWRLVERHALALLGGEF
jgi:acetyl esterase/lipase